MRTDTFKMRWRMRIRLRSRLKSWWPKAGISHTAAGGGGGVWGARSREDNSHHVVTGHETDETAVLDGFTITGGNANRGYWVAYYGGGITADSAGFTLLY